VLEIAADAGDAPSAFELGMMLRDRAQNADDLARSLVWLERAADRGHRDAMFETGYAMGFGLGRTADAAAAVAWLDQAAGVGHPDAAALAQTLRIQGAL
jgi:TPR repeat protein